MKVLLRRDVQKVGRLGEVVEVSAGFARNYLVPMGLAAEPTEANVKALEKDKTLAEQARLELNERLAALASEIDGSEVTIPALANEQGHLFGSVGRREIADALASIGHDVPADSIQLDQPIRELDKKTVEIRLALNVRANLDVWVVPDKEPQDGQPTSADDEPGESQPDRPADEAD
jgi:large subunit ribosomal protein L9